LPDGQNVAIPQREVAATCARADGQTHFQVFASLFLFVGYIYARQVGAVGVSTTLHAAGHPNQIFDPHIAGEGIATRFCHFSLYVYGWRINLRQIAIDEDPIPRLQ
jgi:hypothetical protein